MSIIDIMNINMSIDEVLNHKNKAYYAYNIHNPTSMKSKVT